MRIPEHEPLSFQRPAIRNVSRTYTMEKLIDGMWVRCRTFSKYPNYNPSMPYVGPISARSKFQISRIVVRNNKTGRIVDASTGQ